jgi:hypothetical protein
MTTTTTPILRTWPVLNDNERNLCKDGEHIQAIIAYRKRARVVLGDEHTIVRPRLKTAKQIVDFFRQTWATLEPTEANKVADIPVCMEHEHYDVVGYFEGNLFASLGGPGEWTVRREWEGDDIAVISLRYTATGISCFVQAYLPDGTPGPATAIGVLPTVEQAVKGTLSALNATESLWKGGEE